MKKLLSILFAVQLLFGASVFAQCSADAQYTLPGFYPSTYPEVIVGEAYSEEMTVVIMTDTLINLGYGPMNVTIDSIGVTDIKGLPAGFTYQTNTASAYWPGGGSGCMLLTGTATEGQQGSYPLVIHYDIRALGMSLPDSVTDAVLVVVDPVGVSELTSVSEFSLYQNQPNPVTSSTEIIFDSPVADQYELLVYDVIGHVVINETINATAGRNEFQLNAETLRSGIYFYSVRSELYSAARRMEVNK